MELPNWIGQRDPQWKNELLGFSQTDTIGNEGCLITCISCLIRAFDFPNNQASPHDVNVWLKEHGGYVNENLVVWAKVPEIASLIVADGMTDNLQDIINYLNQGNTLAICQVELGTYMHFVLAYKAVGEVIWVQDPWTDSQKPLSDFGATFKTAHLYHKYVAPIVVPITQPQPIVQTPIVETPDVPVVETPPVVSPVENPVETIQSSTEPIKTQPSVSPEVASTLETLKTVQKSGFFKFLVNFIKKIIKFKI